MHRSSSSRSFGVIVLVVALVGAVLSLSAVEAGAAPPPKQEPIQGTVAHPKVPAVPPIVSEDPLANAGPLSPPALSSTKDAAPTDIDVALKQAAESGQRVEVVSLRTETATVFATPKGTLSEEVSMVPVRVKTGDRWVPVDDSLQSTGDRRLSPKALPGAVSLSPGGAGALVSSGVEGAPSPDGSKRAGDQRVSLSIPGELPAPEVNGPTALYRKAAGGADVRVDAQAAGTSVSWVIPDAAMAQGSYVLNLTTEGVTAKQTTGGGVAFLDAAGEETGSLSAPVMFDSTPEKLRGLPANPGGLDARLVNSKDGQQLVITPDPEYLADPSTVFPVTIDPTLDWGPSGDTTLWSSVPNQNNDAQTTLYAGYNGYTGAARTFIKFNPTTAIEGRQVDSATLKVYQNFALSCTPTQIRAQQATVLSAGATWNTKPSLVGPTITTQNTTGDVSSCPAQVGWKNLDVTPLAQTWAADPATTGTVALLANESDANQNHGFSSKEGANPPVLSVEYRVQPDTPSNLDPAADATVTTLRPTLKAKATAPNYSGNIFVKFDVRDDANAQIAAYSVAVSNGATASYLVPKDKLRPARTYTWTATACTGIGVTQTCSAQASRSFTVNPGLATGQRSYFTYDSTPISDRSGLSVNVASGNLSVTSTDLSMAGINLPLEMSRTYNSLGTENRALGQHWSGSLTSTVRLADDPDGSKIFYGPSGEAVRITKNPDGTYSPSGDLDARFIDAGGFGVYVLEFNHSRDGHQAGDTLYFYSSGALKNRLHSLNNRNNQGIALSYTGTEATQVVDTQNRGVNVTISSGRITEIAYGARSSSFEYDANGDLSKATDAEGKITQYGYDAHLLTKITSPGAGHVIDIAYDGRGRATSVKRTVSGVVEESTYAYNDTPVGGPFSSTVTDARGKTTTYVADHANRVKTATDASGEGVSTGYDDNSNILTVTSGTQSVTNVYSGDSRNNLKSTKGNTGVEAVNTYNESATTGLTPYQPTKSKDPQGNETSYSYDSGGNLQQTQSSLPGANAARVERQGINSPSGCGGEKGQICKTYNQANVATTYSYGYGYLLSVTSPAPLGAQSFTYDTYGRTDSLTDGKGQTRSFDYDKMDRLTHANYGPVDDMSYHYDDVGNNDSRTDLNNSTWTMAYDAANRITGIDGPASPAGYPNLNDVDYSYDKVGNLTSLTDVGGTTNYTFTDINLPATITDPDGGITTYHYDDANNHNKWLTSIDYANGSSTTMGYDESGRLNHVVNTENTEPSTTGDDDGNGGTINDLTYQFRKPSSGTDDQALRSKEITPSGETSFTYDKANRLTSSVYTPNGLGPLVTYNYTYDSVGNRKTSKVGAHTSAFTYNNADQLTTPGVVHDANGNMTSGGAHGYTSQVFNQLDQATSVTPKSESARNQSYTGQLQSTWLADGQTRFANAGSLGIIATATASDLTTFTRDPSGKLISMKRDGKRYHYFHDGRGSVSALTNTAGNATQYYGYEPYGRLTNATLGTLDQPFRWNGEYAINDYDYKIGARRYDASIARWTQTDPSGQDPNSYAYANNDPINNSDPTGLYCVFGDSGDDGCIGGSLVPDAGDVASAAKCGFLLTAFVGSVAGSVGSAASFNFALAFAIGVGSTGLAALILENDCI